jgi:ankyrin repeat protein
MSQAFLKLIQTGATADVAAAVEADSALAAARDPQGVSALLWSIYAGQQLVRDFLLSQLANQGAKLDIFEAAATGDVATLKAILTSNPSSAQSYSGDGWTALHLASAFGTPAAVAVLLEHGASVDAVSQNPQRNQPLHAAMSLSRNLETANLLLNHGAQPNAVQVGGFTPLFSATAANRKDLAELLLARGADAHHRNDLGKTAADFARERGHNDLATWLEAQPL